MKKKGLHKDTIQERTKEILALAKNAKDVRALEHELAFLALDIIEALWRHEITFKQSHVPFVTIGYAFDQKLSAKLSKEARDLLNEGIVLDEVDTPHGPDINLLTTLATKIVGRGKHFTQAQIKSLVTSAASK